MKSNKTSYAENWKDLHKEVTKAFIVETVGTILLAIMNS